MANDEADGHRLRSERISDNDITCLRLAGTIDEKFDGKSLSAQVRGGTLVLDLGGIERISSFGIREWVDFATQVATKVTKLYFVECAPKVVDQLNMVANFAAGGAAKVISFYAPYRCDYCDNERRHIVHVEADREAIRLAKLPERVCAACGNPEYFDEDPLTFFVFMQHQEEFEVPELVQSFLTSRLSYMASDKARKLKIDKQIDERTTFLKLAGDLDEKFPREKLGEGLEGEVIFDLSGIGKIDPPGAAEWRQLVQMITPTVEKVWLLGCPPAFVERLGAPSDLGSKTDVVSFAIPYACEGCRSTSARLVDVAEHWEALHQGKPPEMTCTDCGKPTTCAASDLLLQQMTMLPRPAVDAALRTRLGEFAAKLAARSAPKLPPLPAQLPAPASGRGYLTTAITSALVALLVVGGLLLGRSILRARASAGGEDTVLATSAPQPPAWRSTPFAKEGGQVFFVGRTDHLSDQAEATELADAAALDEAVAQLANGIVDKRFGELVAPQFRALRDKALADLGRARTAGDVAEVEKGRRFVGRAQKRVAQALRLSGEGLVPSDRADVYWEKVQSPQGVRFAVWSRWAFPEPTWKRLEERYATSEKALETEVLTYFPGLGWRFEAVEGVAVVAVASTSPLRLAGVQEGDLLLTILDRVIHGAPAFKKQVEEEMKKLAASGGTLTLQVKRGEGPPFETRLRVSATGNAIAETGPRKPSSGERPKKPASAHGNIWDDNPDE